MLANIGFHHINFTLQTAWYHRAETASYLSVHIRKAIIGDKSRADKLRSGWVCRLSATRKSKGMSVFIVKGSWLEVTDTSRVEGLLRRALLVIFWRRGVRRWPPFICGIRSGRVFLFPPILKADARLGDEAAVGEDAEDIEHPVNGHQYQ